MSVAFDRWRNGAPYADSGSGLFDLWRDSGVPIVSPTGGITPPVTIIGAHRISPRQEKSYLYVSGTLVKRVSAFQPTSRQPF